MPAKLSFLFGKYIDANQKYLYTDKKYFLVFHPMLSSLLSGKLSFHARRSLREAALVARAHGASEVTPEHLLTAIAKEKGSLGSLLLSNLGLSEDTLGTLFPVTADIQGDAPAESTIDSRPLPSFSEALKQTITRAYALASHTRSPYVGSEHLTHALLEQPGQSIQTILDHAHIDAKKIEQFAKSVSSFPGFSGMANLFDLATVGTMRQSNEEESGTPFLDQYGIDLMAMEESDERIQRLGFRHHEVERMIQILGRRNKNNPLLIGEPGVGKTTLVHALAQRIHEGTAGPILSSKRIVMLDLALVVAGTNFRGEFEGRLKEIIREASENLDVILFIDEIHTLVGAGSASGSLDAANILKPALSRGDIQCIGATTLAEHKRHIEKDAALERRFQPVIVAEPTPNEAVEILRESRKQYENFHFVKLPNETLSYAVDLAIRYIPDRFLPDKAFDLVDEAASAVHQGQSSPETEQALRKLEDTLDAAISDKEKAVSRGDYDTAGRLKHRSDELIAEIEAMKRAIEKESHAHRPTITTTDIARVVAQMTRIPLEKLTLDPSVRVIHLAEDLKTRVIGQPTILDTVAAAIIRTWSGVSDPDRPLGSFLFLGPSGVGKTLTAKALAELLFENADALIRLDMSEYMERHTVAQMIGAPAGYVGFGEGGKLTEKVRRMPYSVVLFDEIEKAHPDIFNILLQILDEGFLTDAEGRRVSFRNTIIILTGNIGTNAFNRNARIGFRHENDATDRSFDAIRTEVLSELKRKFRPELLARLDQIAVFEPLGKDDIRTVVNQQLSALKKRLLSQGVSLRYPDTVVEHLTEKSQNPNAGARLVRQNIQTFVETPIAANIVGTARPTALMLKVEGDAIVCQSAARKPARKDTSKPRSKKK